LTPRRERLKSRETKPRFERSLRRIRAPCSLTSSSRIRSSLKGTCCGSRRCAAKRGPWPTPPHSNTHGSNSDSRRARYSAGTGGSVAHRRRSLCQRERPSTQADTFAQRIQFKRTVLGAVDGSSPTSGIPARGFAARLIPDLTARRTAPVAGGIRCFGGRRNERRPTTWARSGEVDRRGSRVPKRIVIAIGGVHQPSWVLW
jgi:hypothetical protein